MNDVYAGARLLHAAASAARKHSSQRRKDAEHSPYINHPLALADLLANDGGVDDVVALCAALLHDTIEDTHTSAEDLRREFDAVVAGIVLEVSDDKSLPKQRRKDLQVEHAARSSTGAKLVKLADKICNLRDIIAAPPADWPRARKQEYFEWARRVVDGVRGVNADLEAIFYTTYREGLRTLGIAA